MLIREILTEATDEVDDMALHISGVLGQLKSSYMDQGAKKPMSTDAALDFLHEHGINITLEDLKGMADKEPIKNLIANINDHNITFLDPDAENDSDNDASKPDPTTKTLEKMAKRAEKKRD